MAALAPFRVPANLRPPDDPEPLSYLWDATDQHNGAIDLTVEAWLLTSALRAAGQSPHRLSQSDPAAQRREPHPVGRW